MPLDLGLWECLWTDDGDDSGVSSSRPIQAPPRVPRYYGDLNAFSRFPDSTESGPEESSETGPQGPISAGGFNRWVVIIRQQFGGWFKLITRGACRYVAAKNRIHNESRREQPT